MDALHQDFRVGFRYPVHFTRRVFSPDNALLRSLVVATPPGPAAAVVVLDAGVARAHPGIVAEIDAYAARHADAMRLAAPVLVVTGGEVCKNDERHLAAIRQHIHAAGLCRHSYVIAVGGGAVLDTAGYAAATAHRGVRLIRVPTTVLAQGDSAVGVKNGVNAFGLKNYLGAFAPPVAVVNDFTFLDTLEDRDWLGGITEAIKVALVKDAAFFEAIERAAPRLAARDAPAMEYVIRQSAALHLAHIASGDPFETGTSRPLDFGHWAAHKLESLTGGGLGHGEAVGIGIALDSTYAHLAGLLAEGDWRRILTLIGGLGLAVYAPALESHVDAASNPRSILRGLDEFREHLGGELTIVLLRGIADPVDVHAVDTDVMIRSMALLRRMAASGAVSARAVSTIGSAPE
jgi:3-dehydroquinate synthase